MNVSIEEKRLKLLLDCVELVSVNGNTFSLLNDSGLKSMLENTLDELKAAGRGVNLTDPHLSEVKEILRETAKNVQQRIREELNNRPFSLQVDITTKRRRSILGVTAQFIMNGARKIRCIAMKELKDSHTGEYLAKIVNELLDEYGIKHQQVMSITTDNGANVLKMTRDITTQIIASENAHQMQSQFENDEATEPCDAQIEDYLQTVPDISDEEALNLLFEQAEVDIDAEDAALEESESLLTAMLLNLRSQHVLEIIWEIVSIHCAAHTLQLCIADALKKLKKTVKNVIALLQM